MKMNQVVRGIPGASTAAHALMKARKPEVAISTHRRAFALGAGSVALLCATCRAFSDHIPVTDNLHTSASAPLVRVAFGWRAREVERQSTARVAFPDDDISAEILENEPVALAYVEPAHPFTLPPGRFLRVNQAAGRVYDVTVTPHLAALAPADATALADSVVRTLEHAGWARVPDEGRGVAAAVADAARYGSDGKGGFGVSHVGTWRVPRPQEPWAARPPDAPPRVREWDGVQALVTVRPVRSRAGADSVRLILEVKLTDQLLSLAFQAQADARRARYGGEMQTLRSWDAQPDEPIPAPR